MIQADINATTLDEFYKQIKEQQLEAHGEGYCDHHSMIADAMKSSKSYKELGTHQGASAAAAILAGAKEAHLVDHNHKLYYRSKHLFESYAECYGIDLNIHEMSSIDKRCAVRTDILMIDSKHVWSWTKQELDLHASKTDQYIILHDTTIVGRTRPSTIGPGVLKWLETTEEGNRWVLERQETRNVGSMMLKRVV